MANEVKVKPKLPIRKEKIKDEKYQVLERCVEPLGPNSAGVSLTGTSFEKTMRHYLPKPRPTLDLVIHCRLIPNRDTY